MVDLETLGNTSGSVIASIGAVAFDLDNGDVGKSFYVDVQIQNALNEGLRVDGSTIQWWLKQSEDARKLIANPTNPLSLKEALNKFNMWLSNIGNRDDLIMWGNSARFDLGILSDAYNITNIKIPWAFRNERCVRTLVSFNPSVKKNMEFEGVRHDPIDDCKHQIKYCHQIWKEFNVKRETEEATL